MGTDEATNSRNTTDVETTIRPYTGYKISKPPIYRGKRDLNTIYVWLRRVDEYLKLYNVSDEIQARVAATYLETEGYVWYDYITRNWEGPGIFSWTVMKQQFETYFSPPNASAYWFDKWETIRYFNDVS